MSHENGTADPSDDATDAEMRVYDVWGDGIVRLERDGEEEQLVVVMNCDEDRGVTNADGNITAPLWAVLGLGNDGPEDTYYEFSPDSVSHVVARSGAGMNKETAKRLVGSEPPTDDRDSSDGRSPQGILEQIKGAGESTVDRVRKASLGVLEKVRDSNGPHVAPVGGSDDVERGLAVTESDQAVEISYGQRTLRVERGGVSLAEDAQTRGKGEYESPEDNGGVGDEEVNGERAQIWG